jgi:rhamnulokinase
MTQRPKASYLTIDLGAGSGRVMTADWDGRSLQLTEQHRFAHRMVGIGNGLHWDLLRLWSECLEGLQKSAQETHRTFRSVGVDTWALDYVLLSKSGEMLGLPRAYRDPRTSGSIEKIIQAVPRTEIFQTTGLQFMEINTLCHLYAQSRENPELLHNAAHLLMIPDWFHWCLSGQISCEFTNATTTQFLDPVRRTWATPMLNRLQIPHSFLPPLTEPGTALGTLRGTVIRETSLSAIRVVAPATHDTASAVVAVPTERTGSASWAYLSSGTWSLVGVEIPRPLLSDDVLHHNFTNEGGVDGTFRLLKNVMGMWLMQQLQATLSEQNIPCTIPELVRAAESAPAFKCIIDPDAGAFLRPADITAIIRSECIRTAQPVPESPGEWARCILESLALRYREVLEILQSLTGTRLEVLHIVGGGSKNALLNQFTADAAGIPVVAGPSEATALGNAAIQMRTDGVFSDLREIRAAVRTSCREELRTFIPSNTAKPRWDEAFGKWTRLFRSAS